MPRIDATAATKVPTAISKLAKPKSKIEKKEYRKKRKGLTGLKKSAFGNRKTYSNMQYAELLAAKDRCIASKQYETAAKYLERLTNLCENAKDKAQLLRELADLNFSQKEFDAAKKWYQEFVRLYPGNQSIEHAKYRVILCTKERILSADRDQTPTEETLQLAQEYLDKETFNANRIDVSTIKAECETLLAQADCGVANFYIKSGDYGAAARRVKTIRNNWLDKVPEMGPTLAQLEVSLGNAWKEFEVPESSIKLAQQTTTLAKANRKTDMTVRF